MENSVIKIYKQAVAANSTRYYDMINRYQVTQQWKRLKRTLQLFKHPVPHAKPSRHNCLKESIESFACVEGGRASSEQITITQHFLAQAKINWSQESWKEKKSHISTHVILFSLIPVSSFRQWALQTLQESCLKPSSRHASSLHTAAASLLAATRLLLWVQTHVGGHQGWSRVSELWYWRCQVK